MMDARSLRNVQTLLPRMQEKAGEWYAKCRAAGLNVVVICGTRTYQEQENLYAIGRTKLGKKVTNARGGYSNHNFGIAFDFVIFDGVDEEGGTGKALWDSPDMAKAGKVAEELGLEWGGNWKFYDAPHIQAKTGKTLAQLRDLIKKGQPII